MIELVQKSLSKPIADDDEYKKMKQRILTIINQSLQDDVFYEQRFNVRINQEILRLNFQYFLVDV